MMTFYARGCSAVSVELGGRRLEERGITQPLREREEWRKGEKERKGEREGKKSPNPNNNRKKGGEKTS